MKTRLLLSILLIHFVVLSCEKTENKTVDAQIIGFDFTKCSCCWGWIIKYGNDTIKTDSLPASFKMIETFPVNVKMELGNKTQNCLAPGMYNYYKVKSIERIE